MKKAGADFEKRIWETETSLPCPQCGHNIRAKFGQLRDGHIKCPSCESDIPVEAQQFERDIGKARKALEDLEKSLRKLGGVRKIKL